MERSGRAKREDRLARYNCRLRALGYTKGLPKAQVARDLTRKETSYRRLMARCFDDDLCLTELPIFTG